ncbi:ATP-grasp fold amidoligase family protein [Pseudozobellia thermophila]|nr:ATP-grasp fold amidoligase family protein [Pseudozobellia thermophila]
MKFIDPELYVKIYYEYYFNKKLDLHNPITFNEKIQWLKVFYRPKILNQLVDKFEVRSYVSEKVGQEYLNELLALASSSDQIDFDKLPDQFVVKATHGCNSNLVVTDKRTLNVLKAKLLFKKWLSRNQYYRGGLEWAYKDIQPRLIVERFIEQKNQCSLNDYKFYCFNGTPTYVQVDMDRGQEHLRSFYNMDWELQPFNKGCFHKWKDICPKPANFNTMIEIATKLSVGFPFVRVDLYNVEGKTIFGEMTFYPGDGRQPFTPPEFDEHMGKLIRLPKIPSENRFITQAFS